MNFELTASKTQTITDFEQLKQVIQDYIDETYEHSNLEIEFMIDDENDEDIFKSVEIMYNMHSSHPCEWVVVVNGEDKNWNIENKEELDEFINFLKTL